MKAKTAEIRWRPSWRIIADSYPPIKFFERVADPAEWELLLDLAKLTDPCSEDVGDIGLIPVADRITGPGSGRVLPSFTFLDPNPPGSQFSNSEFGTHYASRESDTAIAETVFHRETFLRDGGITEPQDIDHLIILADIIGKFDDIREEQASRADIYHLSNYTDAQAFARTRRAAGSFGILYSSVRHTNGECVAVFRPPVISNIREGDRIVYRWDGTRIVGHFRKSDFTPI